MPEPVQLSVSKEIDRPIADVWRFYAVDHIRNHPRWDPRMELWPETEGLVGVGTRIRRRHTRVGTPIEGVMEVVEFEPERTMAVRIRDETPAGPFEVEARATFAPIRANRTRLTLELSLPAAAPSMDPAMIEASLVRIKELVEAEAASDDREAAG